MKRWISYRVLLSVLVLSVFMNVITAEAYGTSETAAVMDIPCESYDDDQWVRAIVLLEDEPEIACGAAEDAESLRQRRHLLDKHESIFRAMSDLNYCLKFEFTRLLNGFSCEIACTDLEKIAAIDGVRSVFIAGTYTVPEIDISTETKMHVSNTLTGNKEMLEQGYQGGGCVVAVLDTGIFSEHEVFADRASWTEQTARLGSECVTADGLHGRGIYISPKIPFAFNYADFNTDVSDLNGHGTYVAAVAAGMALDEAPNDDPEIKYMGAAPAAQILSMKIFSNKGGGTTSDIYFYALEDAYTLGADVITLSIAGKSGFTHSSALETVLFGNIYQRLRDAGILVTVAAGNKGSMADYASGQRIGPEYTDYGTVGSPATYDGNISVASAENAQGNSGEVRMSSFSAWGTTPSLTLDPLITSVGGSVTSAWIAGIDSYKVASGTSIAAPNLAGTYANLLSALRSVCSEHTKLETARLVETLLLGSSKLLKDEDGVYYSPRRQGSGLSNTACALENYLQGGYIIDPIQELGDDPARHGIYTMDLTLRNESDRELHYTAETYVMCDQIAIDQDGHPYNTMSSEYLLFPDGGEEQGASVRYLIDGTPVEEFCLMPGTEVTVRVVIRLSERWKRASDQNFPNGCFVEGYVVFCEREGGTQTHATFLSYHGSWTNAPVLESADFRDLAAGRNLNCYTRPNMAELASRDGTILGIVGDNLLGGASYNESHIALSTPLSDGSGRGTLIRMTPYLLRNVSRLSMTITNRDDNTVYMSKSLVYRAKASYSLERNCWESGAFFSWDGTDMSGNYLPSGTVVTVTYHATLPYRDAVQSRIWSFDLTVDYVAPHIDTVQFDSDSQTLTVTARDENYLQGICLTDAEGKVLCCEIFSSESPGEVCTAVFHVADLTGDETQIFCVKAVDYATNETESLAFLYRNRPCYFDLFPDCEEEWYHEAVDYVCYKGMMHGIGNHEFAPALELSRAMMVTVLYREAGNPEVSEDSTFTDVNTAWYNDAIAWAQDEGIVKGISDTEFAPDQNVTREQIATILWRCAGEPAADGDLSRFADADGISDYAEEAMIWAVAEGIFQGDSKGLRPSDNATRAEFSCIIMRYLDGAYTCN